MLLRAARVGKKFDRRWVVRNIDFELAVGDVLAVLGRNGSGKSTLLKMVVGLISPSEGLVEIPQPTHQRVGYFSLESRVYPSLTVREHLLMACELRECGQNDDEWLDRVGLTHAADMLGSQLSTGMRSRLKLALAAHHAPQLLVLDEAAAGLDEQGRELIDSICVEQIRRGALVVATNEQHERRHATCELRLD